MNEEIERLTRLVDDLRNLSKFDSEKNKLEKEKVNLRYFMQHIIYNYESKVLDN